MHVNLYLSILYTSIYLSIYLSICLSVCLSVCLSIDQSIDPSIRPSIHPSISASCMHVDMQHSISVYLKSTCPIIQRFPYQKLTKKTEEFGSLTNLKTYPSGHLRYLPCALSIKWVIIFTLPQPELTTFDWENVSFPHENIRRATVKKCPPILARCKVLLILNQDGSC